MIETIKKLFSTKEFYKTIKDKKVGSAVGIIAVLSLVIGIVASVNFYVRYGLNLKNEIDGFLQTNIVSEFPNDLKITNVSGVLNSNLNPVTLGGQSELLDKPVDGTASYNYDRGISSVLTIDTTKEATMRNLEESGSAIFIGSDGMIAVKSNGQVQAAQSRDFPDFVVDKTVINEVANKIYSYTYLAAPAIALIILSITFIFTFIAWIITSFVASVATLIASKFGNTIYTWDNCVRIAFYVGIPVIFILNVLAQILPMFSPISVPLFWPSVILIPVIYFLWVKKS